MGNYSNGLSIKSWAEADKPREKLADKGREALTEAELIAILIGSGTRKETAVDLGKRILSSVNNNLVELGRLTLHDLQKFSGIGEAKAIAIVAALELGRRRREREPVKMSKIGSSKDVYAMFEPMLSDLPHEEFWAVMLNRANKVIKKVNISRGGTSGTVADPKLIFKHALEVLASSIVLCHNHPSGNLSPSKADIALTKKLKGAGEMMSIPILDHIIVSDQGYYSFADQGQL